MTTDMPNKTIFLAHILRRLLNITTRLQLGWKDGVCLYYGSVPRLGVDGTDAPKLQPLDTSRTRTISEEETVSPFR